MISYVASACDHFTYKHSVHNTVSVDTKFCSGQLELISMYN